MKKDSSQITIGKSKEGEPAFLKQRPKIDWLWTILGLILAGSIALVDYLTGPAYPLSLTYLIPVIIASWFVGKPFGFAISVLSVGAWTVTEIASSHLYSFVLVHCFYTIYRLAFFVVVVLLLGRVKKALSVERALSRVDYLTRVMNSRSFYELASTEIERCRRYGHPFTVAYIDIDNFKRINDEFGHIAGDNTLQDIADTMKTILRKIDIVARLGGDEFAILFPETEGKDAITAIEKIRKSFKQQAELEKLSVTLSIGILTCKACPPSVDKMIAMVDKLMYSVKKSGKNGLEHSVYTG